MKRCLASLIVIVLIATSVFGQLSADATLGDGSFIVLTVPKDQYLEVETRYGSLRIPFSEIGKIEFGHHVRPGEGEKIAALIKELGSKSFNERDAALKSLVAYGEEAWYLLQGSAKHPDTEVSLRINRILAQLGPIKVRKQFDTVMTVEGQISGKVRNPIIKGVSIHFGEVSLRPCDLRDFFIYSRQTKDIVVDASNFILPDKWIDTGIDLAVKQKIDIKAEGSVDIYPATPGQYVVGPNGGQWFGKNSPSGFRAGSLVAKIGDGNPVLASSLEASRSGRLYLRIVESQWDVAIVGVYQVSIRVGGR